VSNKGGPTCSVHAGARRFSRSADADYRPCPATDCVDGVPVRRSARKRERLPRRVPLSLADRAGLCRLRECTRASRSWGAVHKRVAIAWRFATGLCMRPSLDFSSHQKMLHYSPVTHAAGALGSPPMASHARGQDGCCPAGATPCGRHGLRHALWFRCAPALVPLPRQHQVRYGGCLAPHSHLRAAILPTLRQQGADEPEGSTVSPTGAGHECSSASLPLTWHAARCVSRAGCGSSRRSLRVTSSRKSCDM
jgi:hypothetical protein